MNSSRTIRSLLDAESDLSPLLWLEHSVSLLSPNEKACWEDGETPDDDEEKAELSTPEARLIHVLQKFVRVFKQYDEDYKLLLSVYKGDEETIARGQVNMAIKLGGSIRDLRVELNTHIHQATITNEVVKAFEEAKKAKVKYIDSHPEAHQQSHLLETIFTNIKEQKINAKALLQLAEAKAAEDKKLVTKEKFYGQVAALPTQFYKFYKDMTGLKTADKQRLRILILRDMIGKMTTTFEQLNCSEASTDIFADSVRRSMAAKDVFIGDLLKHGQYDVDINKLLLQAHTECSETLVKISEVRGVNINKSEVEPMADLVRLTYGIHRNVVHEATSYTKM